MFIFDCFYPTNSPLGGTPLYQHRVFEIFAVVIKQTASCIYDLNSLCLLISLFVYIFQLYAVQHYIISQNRQEISILNVQVG
jgi:hypothetical protein